MREFGSDRSRVLRVLASALVGALWSPVLWRLATRGEAYTVLGINDFPLHVEVAERTTLIPLHIESPHLLFHVGVALTRGVVGLQAAPTFVVGLAVAATAWMVMWCFVDGADGPALTPGRAIVVACVFFLSESPAAVAAWAGWIGPTQPFMTLHWWGNPTWLVALPSAVGALVVATRLFAAAPARLRGMRSGVPLAVVVGVGALAKPAFVLCLLPGLVLFAVANRRTVSRAHVLATLPAVAVGTIVLVWQMWFLAESPDSKFSSGWTFDPIVAPVYGWGRIGLVFLLPLLLPALAATWCRRSFLARISVRLLLACTVFAAAIMLCINETGERSTHGNFAVPMQTCATLLVVAAIKELSIAVPEQLRTLGGVRRWAAIGATTGAAAVFMAGGAVTYAGAMGIVSDRVRWEQGAVRDEPLGGYDPHPAHALREAIGHASASPPP